MVSLGNNCDDEWFLSMQSCGPMCSCEHLTNFCKSVGGSGAYYQSILIEDPTNYTRFGVEFLIISSFDLFFLNSNFQDE